MKLFASFVLTLAMLAPAAFAQPAKPKSVIHVINVKFKADASKADIDKAIAGIAEMKHPGLKNVWLKTIKNQMTPNFTHILVMEFDSQESFDKYSESPAQKKWYDVYLKVRDESRTNDVTN
ncbi:MAG: Dabb family protein [Bryobacteraceae bacterium]|nr:Dabb family protein [Bryobacteraceae bacterium]